MSGKFRNQASLALNVVLLVAVGGLALHKLARASVASVSESGPVTITHEASLRTTSNETAVSIPQPKLPQYGDMASALDRRRSIIEQLRAMGVPNDMLALVARADFELQWESRFQACGGDRDKLDALQLEMDMNKDAEMRSALGEAGFKQWDQKNMLWEAMSTAVEVAPAETEAIYDLKKKLQQHALELEQARIKGTMDDAEINDAQEKAYAEYNQQLKAVLGDERYAKSQQLDDTFVAGNLRYTLGRAGVNPGDSQFQELLKAEQAWNKSQLKLDAASEDYATQLKALSDARDEAYRQALGADTFDTLQKEQDPGYTEMKKYETLWGLDDQKIDYVYSTMKSYEKSIQDYQAQVSALQVKGQKVDWDAVNKNLQHLTDETGQKLQSYVGQESFNTLQRNHFFLFHGIQPPQ